MCHITLRPHLNSCFSSFACFCGCFRGHGACNEKREERLGISEESLSPGHIMNVAVESAARPGGLLRIVGYNPCAASTYERITDIIHELASNDVSGIIGTQRRGKVQVEEFFTIGRHNVYHFPQCGHALTNKSCGCTICVKRTRLPHSSLKIVYPVPEALWGRCAAIRF